MRPTWKNTLNTDLGTYGLVSKGCQTARELRYPFFSWGGAVYPVEGFQLGQPICLTADIDHGEEHQCSRSGCGLPNATWFNWSTRHFYCERCAKRINEQPGRPGCACPPSWRTCRRGRPSTSPGAAQCSATPRSSIAPKAPGSPSSGRSARGWR